MENMKIVGIRHVDFTDKQGRQIVGITLYVTHPAPNVDGEIAEKLFVSADKLDSNHYVPAVGDMIGVSWGRNNRIIGVCKVKSNG